MNTTPTKSEDVGVILTMIEQMPSASFKNEHGERFTIHSNGVMVFMSGDEVNMMVDDNKKIGGKFIQLFNNAFGIWNILELRELAQALLNVTDTLAQTKRKGLINE